MGASYDLLVENVVENVAVVRMLLSFQQMFLLGGGANRFLGRRRQKSWYDLEKCNVCIWMVLFSPPFFPEFTMNKNNVETSCSWRRTILILLSFEIGSTNAKETSKNNDRARAHDSSSIWSAATTSVPFCFDRSFFCVQMETVVVLTHSHPHISGSAKQVVQKNRLILTRTFANFSIRSSTSSLACC